MIDEIPNYNIGYSELLGNMERYSSDLLEKKAVGFKGINLSIKQQKNISLILNNIFDFQPKTKEQFHIFYKESHSHVLSSKENNKDSILIDWHLEHAESNNPQVLAVWNMRTFKCDTSCGKTGFVDSQKILETLSDREINFLHASTIISVNDDNSLSDSFIDEKNIHNKIYPHNALEKHPVNGQLCLRVDVLNHQSLYRYNNMIPNSDQKSEFNRIYSKILFEVTKNKDNQIWWSWQKGDLLIVDLFCMYHAVKGGFSRGQRVFTGFWSFIS